jgi:hypothetical protein
MMAFLSSVLLAFVVGAVARTVYLSDETNPAYSEIIGDGTDDFTFTVSNTAYEGYMLGVSIAYIDDFNGDGYSDMAVSTYDQTVYILYGGENGFPSTSATDLANFVSGPSTGFRIYGRPYPFLFGQAIHCLGDINGDGKSDIIIGAPWEHIGEMTEDTFGNRGGAAYVIFGSDISKDMYMEDFTAGKRGFKFLGKTGYESSRFITYQYLGTSLGSGDFNGDGVTDFVIGADRSLSSFSTQGGAAYVYYGKKDGYTEDISLQDFTTGSEGFKIVGQSNGDICGKAVGNAGDINNDGIDDLFVTAPNRDAYINGTGYEKGGIALIVYGTATPFERDIPVGSVNIHTSSTSVFEEWEDIGFLVGGGSTREGFGFAMSAAGDINNDGIVDVVIGAPFYGKQINSPIDGDGKAYVIYGQTGIRKWNIDTAQLEEGVDGFSITGNGTNALGYVVHGGFDINNDGFSDVAVSSGLNGYGFDRSPRVTEVFVINGASSITKPIHADEMYEDQGFAVVGSMNGSDVGFALDSGDMNGDGIPDLLVTAPSMETDSGNINGRSYIVYGSFHTPSPTQQPTDPSAFPTPAPTEPTATPTTQPTDPTAVPTRAPTSEVPTSTPTYTDPTAVPTRAPTSEVPTSTPTSEGGGTSSSGSGGGSGTGAAVGGVVAALLVLGVVAAAAYVYLMKKQNPLSAADENRASTTSGDKDMVQNDQL